MRPLILIALLLAACGGNVLNGGGNHQPPDHSPSINGACPIFPADNPWNTDISSAPLDARSDAWVASVGTGAAFHPDFGSVYGMRHDLTSLTRMTNSRGLW